MTGKKYSVIENSGLSLCCAKKKIGVFLQCYRKGKHIPTLIQVIQDNNKL